VTDDLFLLISKVIEGHRESVVSLCQERRRLTAVQRTTEAVITNVVTRRLVQSVPVIMDSVFSPTRSLAKVPTTISAFAQTCQASWLVDEKNSFC